jgi:predicted Zn-dependent protease
MSTKVLTRQLTNESGAATTARVPSPPELPLQTQALSTTDQRHLRDAQEWLERKDYLQAQFQIDKISPAARMHPDVLQVTMGIHYGFQHHLKVIEVGRRLVTGGKCLDRSAIWLMLADSLHQLGRTHEAYEQLKQFARHFRRDGLVYYRLAVYACLLGKSDEAKAHFTNVMTTPEGARLKREALEDEHLRDIWDFLCQP